MTFRNILSENDAKALEEFARRAREAFGSKILDIRLFGSKARGDASADSDIDVALLFESLTDGVKFKIFNIAFDVNLEFDVYISPRVISKSAVENPIFSAASFLRDIMKEGLAA
jgi:predicted nucleotidyltransferase